MTFVEAAAGMGRSRLLDATAEMAAAEEIVVLRASGRELERDFPFGVALQLFEQHWLAADELGRARLFDGPAQWAERLASPADDVRHPLAAEHSFAVIHGLFWVVRNLGAPLEERAGKPAVALIIDDVNRADSPSLRFLAYLAARLSELSIALVVSARVGEPATDPSALAALRATTGGAILRPARLSREGVAQVAAAEFPGATPAFGDACAEITGGNPFMLAELLAAARRADAEVKRPEPQLIDGLVPEGVVEMVGTQLAQLPAEAGAVAGAMAVLGDEATLPRVAAVAELDGATAAAGADALVEAQLLVVGPPLAFTCPLIARCVRVALPASRLAQLGRRATRTVAREAAPGAPVASVNAEPLP
jgi:hypothetical protein